MNIYNLHNSNHNLPSVPKALFAKMEQSLKSGGANFEQSVRIAKTIAPILQDQSSNARHLELISSDASTQEKVIAILMLGFPKNRQVLPTLKNILLNGSDSLAMAASIAISQMGDGKNNELLIEILVEGFQTNKSVALKKTIRQNIPALLDKKTAHLVQRIFNDHA